MIAANAVAIPTARTHQSPKRTVVTRTTYSIVKTPNVSAVHADPYAKLLSANVSQSHAGVGAAAAARSTSSRRTQAYNDGSAFGRTQSNIPFSMNHLRTRDRESRPQSTHHRASSANQQLDQQRRIMDKMDAVIARNRELELQVLQLKQDMMQLKAGKNSMQRLLAPKRSAAETTELPNNHRSSSALGATTYAGAQRKNGSSQKIETRHALELIDELRETLAHDQAPAVVKKKKAKKVQKRRDESDYVYTSEISAARPPLQSPPRPAPSHLHDATGHDRSLDDAEFDALQRSYWQQSQSILHELDKKLQEMAIGQHSYRSTKRDY